MKRKLLVAKPDINKINVAVFVAVGGVSEKTLMDIWHKAYKFQSWDLKSFAVINVSDFTIFRIRKIIALSIIA